MNQNLKIFETKLEKTSEKVLKTLDYNNERDRLLVREAIELVEQDALSHLRDSEDSIQGTVFAEDNYLVQISLSFLEMSRCTCPSDYYCEHQLALIFHRYRDLPDSNLDDLISNWEESQDLDKIVNKFGITSARHSLEVKNKAPEIDEWIAYINPVIDQVLKLCLESPSFKTGIEHERILFNNLKAANKQNRDLRILFNLTAELVSVKYLLAIIKYIDEDYYVVNNLIDSLILSIDKNIGLLKMSALPFNFDELEKILSRELEDIIKAELPNFTRESTPFLAKLFDSIREDSSQSEVSAKNMIVYKAIFSLFQNFWGGLFRSKKLQTETIETLSGLIAKEGSEAQLVVYKVCLAYLHFINKADGDCVEVIKGAPLLATYFISDWLSELSRSGDLVRQGFYVDLVTNNSRKLIIDELEKIEEITDEEIRQFSLVVIHFIKDYSYKNNQLALYERFLKSLLPLSVNFCFTFYRTEKMAYEYLELLSYTGTTVNQAIAKDLQAIRVSEPRLLLRNYHQSIQTLVEQRSRAAYRQVAVLLKKLRDLYVELEEELVWEIFLNRFSKKTVRLRALHEECSRLGISLTIDE